MRLIQTVMRRRREVKRVDVSERRDGKPQRVAREGRESLGRRVPAVVLSFAALSFVVVK